MKPTEAQYAAYQQLFDHFNDRLFDNKLPACMLTFADKGKRSEGYFSARSWAGNGQTVHEISLNPEFIKSHSLKKTLAVLVHQMTHVWQYEYGTPSRKGYHNRQWAAKMKALGLIPSSTGEADGSETGQQMSQMVKLGGRFEQVYQAITDSYSIPFQIFDTGQENDRRGEREKYVCKRCRQNVWSKPGLKALCGECGCAFEGEASGTDADLEAWVYALLRERYANENFGAG